MTAVRAIAAVAANGVIGADGALPWSDAEDFARLKALTTGGVLVMGRRTYDSIGRPLPGRTSYVVTRDPAWAASVAEWGDRVRVFSDPDAALDAAVTASDNVWVFGGGEIYRALWDRIDVLEITEIAQRLGGDTRFPDVDRRVWRETAREQRPGFAWVTYERRAPRQDNLSR